MFKGSRYAERLPIGKKHVIENADYETIRSFYKDWYRPNLMAIVAVGDLDPREMEVEIKKRFSKIKNPKRSRERKEFDVPSHQETYVAIEQDKEASFTTVQIEYKQNDDSKVETLENYRLQLTYQLFNSMLSQRLSELRESAEPPFVFGSTRYGRMVRTKKTYSSFAMTGEDGILEGLLALTRENQRVRQYGFTEGELERAKKRMLNSMESEVKEKEKTESAGHASRLVSSFLNNSTVISPDFIYEFAKQQFSGVTVNEINNYAPEWIKENDRVVVITGPENKNSDVTEASVLALLKQVSQEELGKYEDNIAGAELMSSRPAKGSILSERKHVEVGITEIELSNGVRVILKSTDFQNDEVLMSAYSKGGGSLYENEFHHSASYAGEIVDASGVASYSNSDLSKLFSGKTVQVGPYIGMYTEGFDGSAAPKDLETMMQLIHLYFTAPRKDEGSFASYKTRNIMLFKNLMSNPQFFFGNESTKILSQNHPRAGGFPTLDELEKIDLDKVYEIYAERFSDPSGFTFFFVGNFEDDTIRDLLTTYLASIPTNTKTETWRDLGIRPPKGKLEKVIVKGTDPKSLVSINYRGDAIYTAAENYKLLSLGEVLTNRLIDLIREEKSGVYGIGARGSISQRPYENYSFSISFPCGPENVADLKQAVYDEIALIKREGISTEDLNEIKEAQRIDRKESLEKNRYWLRNLSRFYQYDRDINEFHAFDKMIEKLTVGDIQSAANKFLIEGNLIEIILMPEE